METPSYYSIIPAEVRYDEELTPNAKLLYGEITCLANKEGFCFASNSYFANLYKVTPQAISRWIKSLENGGYIKTELIYDGNEVKQRKIYLSEVSINIDRVSIKSSGGINKKLGGYQQKVKDNNTSINNTRVNNIATKKTRTKKDFVPPTVEEVSDYCQKMGYKVNAKDFVDYYTDPENPNVWKDKNNEPVKNWKLKLKCWNSNSHKNNYYGSAVSRSGCDDASGIELNF